MGKIQDITGQRFGQLVALRPDHVNSSRQMQWLVRCDCGVEKVVCGAQMRRGRINSCGCLNEAFAAYRKRSHGLSYTKTYRTWEAMKRRCQSPASKHYRWYGERGITVCDRWQSFENFLADMGERPDGLTLDRIDVNGNYEPGNCRWATWAEQCANRRPKQLRDGARNAAP